MSDSTQSRFGFVNFAETWNGRLAMLGFVIGLGTELLTGQGILSQIGLGGVTAITEPPSALSKGVFAVYRVAP